MVKNGVYMKKLFCILFFLSTLNISAQENTERKEICITIDDLPYVATKFTDVESGKKITEKILTSLNKFNAFALGSVNAGKLFNGDTLIQDKVDMLKAWLDAGMTLANHTYSHSNYNNLTFAEFKQDIINGEKILKDLIESYGQKLIYFRHPYLFRGDTKEKADSLASFLNENGYIGAPVSIDNSDYIYSWAYEKALSEKNDSLANRIAIDYISHMEKALVHYEGQSKKLFGYNIKQILLMHANPLNADYMDELLQMFVNHGYKFITLAEALKDTAYKTKDGFYKKAGISWLDRWAYTQGHRGDFYAGEPVPEDYIMELLK
jgi:peptidoglycan/xylan/chitin deacetylase (PgdA/CDA1 family)